MNLADIPEDFFLNPTTILDLLAYVPSFHDVFNKLPPEKLVMSAALFDGAYNRTKGGGIDKDFFAKIATAARLKGYQKWMLTSKCIFFDAIAEKDLPLIKQLLRHNIPYPRKFTEMQGVINDLEIYTYLARECAPLGRYWPLRECISHYTTDWADFIPILQITAECGGNLDSDWLGVMNFLLRIGNIANGKEIEAIFPHFVNLGFSLTDYFIDYANILFDLPSPLLALIASSYPEMLYCGEFDERTLTRCFTIYNPIRCKELVSLMQAHNRISPRVAFFAITDPRIDERNIPWIKSVCHQISLRHVVISASPAEITLISQRLEQMNPELKSLIVSDDVVQDFISDHIRIKRERLGLCGPDAQRLIVTQLNGIKVKGYIEARYIDVNGDVTTSIILQVCAVTEQKITCKYGLSFHNKSNIALNKFGLYLSYVPHFSPNALRSDLANAIGVCLFRVTPSLQVMTILAIRRRYTRVELAQKGLPGELFEQIYPKMTERIIY